MIYRFLYSLIKTKPVPERAPSAKKPLPISSAGINISYTHAVLNQGVT
nr:hypothetical protein [Candidatus Mycoplasma haematolamae]